MMQEQGGDAAATGKPCPEKGAMSAPRISRGSRVQVCPYMVDKRWPRWAAFSKSQWGPAERGTVVWRKGVRALIVLDGIADDYADSDRDGIPSIFAHLVPAWALVRL